MSLDQKMYIPITLIIENPVSRGVSDLSNKKVEIIMKIGRAATPGSWRAAPSIKLKKIPI
jgi:hypothetical protein